MNPLSKEQQRGIKKDASGSVSDAANASALTAGLEKLRRHIGRMIEIEHSLERYNDYGEPWRQNYEQKIMLEGVVEQDGAHYLVGHYNGYDYLIAPNFKVNPIWLHMSPRWVEEFTFGRITRISSNDFSLRLEDFLEQQPSLYGESVVKDEWKRDNGSHNHFLTAEYLNGEGMRLLFPLC